jgi:hypothetical protein
MTTKNTIVEPAVETAVEIPAETIEETTDTTVELPTEDEPEAAPDTLEEPTTGNREAAKYRRQAREAETERDVFREQLTTARAEILRNTVETMRVDRTQKLNPAAFDDAITEADQYFTPDGGLDKTLLSGHLAAMHTTKPHWFVTDMTGLLYVPSEGAYMPKRHSSQTWERAFTDK